jgi:GNAT superfamily N-acetyltransferase
MPAASAVGPDAHGMPAGLRGCPGDRDRAVALAGADHVIPWSGDGLLVTVRPLDGDVCGTGIFTHPAFRRTGIHTATTLTALHRLRGEGHRRAIACVAWCNRASLRVERDRAGRATVGAVGYWTLGRWRRYFAEGQVRFEAPRTFHVVDDAEACRPAAGGISDPRRRARRGGRLPAG